mmetsp:Transcript_29918/g.58701  ORF Transcript_29918/g.58701 Transcript_29918/m.58701 type:complete len:163 (+) Transcript_29918:314-802(+)
MEAEELIGVETDFSAEESFPSPSDDAPSFPSEAGEDSFPISYLIAAFGIFALLGLLWLRWKSLKEQQRLDATRMKEKSARMKRVQKLEEEAESFKQSDDYQKLLDESVKREKGITTEDRKAASGSKPGGDDSGPPRLGYFPDSGKRFKPDVCRRGPRGGGGG